MTAPARNALLVALPVVALAVASGVSVGCSSDSSAATSEPAPVVDCSVEVDRFKELMIVDPAVIDDARSKNRTAGPWSFRTLSQAFMPDGADPSVFLTSWLDNWADTTTVNGFATDLESRAEQIRTVLVCPWLHRTPENECDTTCDTCRTRKLDLAEAPFRLTAIVSRFDLHDRPDPDANGLGEGRFVFAFTNGPADDPSSTPLAMTMLFEYALPHVLSLKDWAEAWHHLGTHPAFDDAYRAELQSITDRFSAHAADPTRPNGSALARVRTNESAFNWIWQLRQFTLDGGGDLRLSPVTNTPGATLNGSTFLRDYVRENLTSIVQDRHVMPKSMLGGTADLLRIRWSIPDVDENTRVTFARSTCNGCHAENPTVDTAFHISPRRSGVDKLSAFVNNPADPAHDELARRETKLKQVLCQP